jgi:hypothetical protein
MLRAHVSSMSGSRPIDLLVLIQSADFSHFPRSAQLYQAYMLLGDNKLNVAVLMRQRRLLVKVAM